MKKAFDKTLAAITSLQDAIEEIKTEKLTSDSQKIQDVDKIIHILERSQDVILEAIVIFHKYERDTIEHIQSLNVVTILAFVEDPAI